MAEIVANELKLESPIIRISPNRETVSIHSRNVIVHLNLFRGTISSNCSETSYMFNIDDPDSFRNALTKFKGSLQINSKDTRFEELNKRFEELNERFEELNKRFEELNKRFEEGAKQ